MKKLLQILLLSIFILAINSTEAQRYITKKGVLKAKYKAPHGEMQAENKMVAMAVDTKTGAVQINIVMLSFRFSGPFAQQQFNDYFKKNAHFSNSTFKGSITNLPNINFNKKGKYSAEVVGELTFRRITNKVKADVQIEVEDETVYGKTKLIVNLLDFNFKLPASMEKNVEMTVEGKLDKLK